MLTFECSLYRFDSNVRCAAVIERWPQPKVRHNNNWDRVFLDTFAKYTKQICDCRYTHQSTIMFAHSCSSATVNRLIFGQEE